MENLLQIKIGKLINKIAKNKKSYERKRKKELKIHRQMEVLQRKRRQLTELYEFYMNVIDMKSDEQRKEAIQKRHAVMDNSR